MKTRMVRLASVLSLLLAGACGGSSAPTQMATGQVTFWQDVAPIYNQRCVRCHQAGGIGPFRLDDYTSAKSLASLELARVSAGTMPPYFMVHDGSCGTFHDETTLSDAEKTTIAAWVNGGTPEGTPATLTLPAQPSLAGAMDVSTPMFSPMAQGTPLALNDEYRCFVLDPPNTSDAFLTGYDVSPGEPSIVHHVIGFVVDPAAPAGGGMTNAAVMQSLQAQSPNRIGWPCFGSAGDGLNPNGVPVTWAPGQGVVSYPDGMGVPIHATDKLVVQVHYNLADPASADKSDSTKIHLRFASSVNRELAFLLPDSFLDTLGNATPDSLPPGNAHATYSWTQTGQQMGLDGIPSVDLVAVMPHMHGRGLSQTMTFGDASPTCESDIQQWSFHWQEFYFYKGTLPQITPTTKVNVTCTYDTSADTEPVLPGWGTRNEMCLTVLMVALPAQQ
jgi:hypothetical protein